MTRTIANLMANGDANVDFAQYSSLHPAQFCIPSVMQTAFAHQIASVSSYQPAVTLLFMLLFSVFAYVLICWWHIQ